MRIRPDDDHQQGAEQEEVGRDREDVAGLADAAQVRDRDQADAEHTDLDPDRIQAGIAETICSTADDVETAAVRL